jgi:hypothetical protein
MSDDTKTREAVGRVRLDLELRARHYAHPDYEQETTEGAFSWAEVRAVMNALDDALEDCDDLGAVLTLAQQEAATVESNHRAEVDAATTAERERVRHAVAEAMRDVLAKHSSDGKTPEAMTGQEFYERRGMEAVEQAVNAALADVARIIDAEGA